MKIIFLDIDGVLETENQIKWRLAQQDRGETDDDNWCPQACVNVNNLADKVPGDVGIVVTSSWRKSMSITELRHLIEHNDITVPVVDKTPNFGNGVSRGEEIERWFEEYSKVGAVTDYVILDDDDDFFDFQQERLVCVDSSDGFANFDKLTQAIKILQ